MGSDWAVDLANVGAVYPWQGLEVIMVLLAVVGWIAWHVIQIRQENAEFGEDIARHGSTESIRRSLDEHPI
ncbi:MAG TPA: hypothetical protein VGA77_12815 [Propylenella sp.]